MSAVVIAGDVSGTVTLDAPAVAGTTVLTLPATSGSLMVNGPAFSSYANANLSISSATFTKIRCNVEEFDTNLNYDNATNYRFTPTVAGYYQISGSVSYESGIASITRYLISIYKNGVEYKRGVDSTSNGNIATISNLLYLNGSTDYVELYGYATGTNLQFAVNGTFNTWFTGCLVRGA
jgi:hypothetical protein